MAEKLLEREHMSRFVSEDILTRISGGMEQSIQPGGGERLSTTVMVSDIRGFTKLSEQHSPEMVVSMLNDYFTAMEACIYGESGIIVSFIGDAVIAHFPTVLDQQPGALRSTKAAWNMRLALSNPEWNRPCHRHGHLRSRWLSIRPSLPSLAGRTDRHGQHA
mgnify:CR=1 FL=1